MGNKSSSKNKKINENLQKSKEIDRKFIKILLLGAGESGKSTIFKQLRIISGVGFSLESRQEFKPKLVLNVIEGCMDILGSLKPLGIELTSSKGQEMAEVVTGNKESKTLTKEIASAIQYLWEKDDGFKEAYGKRSQYQLQDTWHFFADSLKDYPKWGGKDWVPSVDDVIRARVRTSGIVDETFNIKKVPFRLFDVGGQRNERKKWIHCFEDVTAIFFVVALQEYDQVLFEDSSQNRLIEALSLFKETVTNEYFKNTPVILFMNKSDLFREKVCKYKIPLNASNLFPGAPKTTDYNEALKWMKKKFLSGLPKEKDVYIFDTCATDTKNIDKVFAAASDIILRKNLNKSGLV